MFATSLETKLVKRARDAQGRDWSAAAEAAAELRRSFPEQRVGYEVGAAALRALRRFDEATAVLAEAESYFSGQPWLLVEQASIAQAAGDLVAAQRLASETRTQFPDNRAAYRIGLLATRSLRRFDEASAIAAEAASRFPDQAWPVAEQAWNAHARGNAKEAGRLATELRGRFPENGAGYHIGSMVARSLRLFDEAASIHATAATRFADQVWLGSERAWTAQARGDLNEASELAAELRRRFPENTAGYQIECTVARATGRFEDASSILEAAAGRFSDMPWVAVERASIAQARGDWDEARKLATELRDRFPENPAGYRIGVASARAVRNLEEADGAARAAVAKFPNESWPISLQASNACARGDYGEALRIAGELRGQYPTEEVGYSLGVGWLRNQNSLGEAQAVLREAQPQFSTLPWFVRNSIELLNLTANRVNAARLIETLRGEGWEKSRAEATGAGTGDRVVVVLGMHRGGTSLCAKTVSRLGFSLGGPLLPPEFDNPDGFYEHAEINRLHEALLAQLGATWDTTWSVREALDTNSLAAEANATVGQLKAIVAEQLRGSGGRWAFKDPRTAWLLPIWLQVFDDLDITPTWLLAVRDPRAVAASLYARNRLPLELGELLWVEHYLNALRHLGPQIAAVVHYESWFSSPREQIEEVARALDASPAEATEIVENSVIADLGHNKPGSGEPILGLTREVYGWLRAQTPDFRRLQREAQAASRALEAIGRANPQN